MQQAEALATFPSSFGPGLSYSAEAPPGQIRSAIEGAVIGHAHHPGLGRAFGGIELDGPFKKPQEHLLYQLFGLAMIVDDAVDHAIEKLGIAIEKQGESLFVAGRNARQKLFVSGFGLCVR
jgi:hypothetical protein